MWAAAGFSPVRAQCALQILGCLVQRWSDVGAVRCLLFCTRAHENFVDLPLNLSREDAGEHCAQTLQHAFPQDRVTTHKVQYEYTWLSDQKREGRSN